MARFFSPVSRRRQAETPLCSSFLGFVPMVSGIAPCIQSESLKTEATVKLAEEVAGEFKTADAQ